MELLRAGVAALRLGGAVEIKGLGWTCLLEQEPSSPWAGAWQLQKCWWQLLLTEDFCFDVEPSALGVAFSLEADAREGES